MYKITLSVVFVSMAMLITSPVLFAQSPELEAVFTEVASNNKQLQAYAAYMESRQLSNETMNNIDDMQFSGAYLPFGNHNAQFVEFQLSQTFEFPSAYKARTTYAEQDQKAEQIAYLMDKQNVLLEVKEICTQLVYQQKVKEVESIRSERALKVYESIRELFDKEQVGKLDLNKARIAWLQQQFAMEQIDASINNLMTQLKGLNGGKEIVFGLKDYDGDLIVNDLESLWQEKLASDPSILFRNESESTALANVDVQKKEHLPKFDIGLNYEGVKGENYAGFSGGIGIPIWNRKNTVRAAQAYHLYEQQRTDAITNSMHSEFTEWYQQYNYLLDKYLQYQNTLEELDSEQLLTKAYELGEFSYLEYYMELKFYQRAYDDMLEMEQQLHLLRNKLLKHEL